MLNSQSLSALRHWLVSRRQPDREEKFRHQHRKFHPLLEFLEDRTAPAATEFVWSAAVDASWNDEANWKVGGQAATEYPHDTDHVAIFDGDDSNTKATITQAGVNVGAVKTRDGYTGQIKLNFDLTIKTGGGAGDSVFDSAVEIAPQNVASDLILDGVTVVVHRGTIGSTTNKSTIVVKNNSLLRFDLKSYVTVGMDLIVGDANGGTGKGDVRIYDSNAGADEVGIELTNNAIIDVNKDSHFYLDGKDGDGEIQASGGPSTSHVNVEGSVHRGGEGLLIVGVPFYVDDGGELEITSATGSTELYIDSDGLPITGNDSLYVDVGGKLVLGRSGRAQVATLWTSDDIYFYEGKLYAWGDETEIVAYETVTFYAGQGNESLISLSDNPNVDEFTDLSFDFTEELGVVRLLRAEVTFDVKGGATNQDGIDVYNGDLEIAAAGTTLDVTRKGNAGANDAYDLFIVEGSLLGIQGDFATRNLPAGLSRVIYYDATLDVDIYHLSSKANNQGRVWDDTDNDGIQEVGEPGLEGVLVNLRDDEDTLVAYTYTDADGNFSFIDVDADDYYLELEAPAGYDFTISNYQGTTEDLDSDATFTDPTDSYGTTGIFTLEIGDLEEEQDAGFFNTAPTAVDDAYVTSENEQLVEPASTGLLNNDYDDDSDPIEVSWYDQPSHGSVTVNSDGSFTYTPDTDYSGDDSFTYKITDGTEESAAATVDIEILPGLPWLLAAAAPAAEPVLDELEAAQAAPIFDEAIVRWTNAGADANQVAVLQAVAVKTIDLPGDGLGLVDLDRSVVWLDVTAFGHGWFIDPTPADDVEYAAQAAPPPGMDLLTVVSHELGHVLGLADLDPTVYPDNLMADRLSPGERRSPTAENLSGVSSETGPTNLPVSTAAPTQPAEEGLAFAQMALTMEQLLNVAMETWTPTADTLARAPGESDEESSVQEEIPGQLSYPPAIFDEGSASVPVETLDQLFAGFPLRPEDNGNGLTWAAGELEPLHVL